MGTLPPRSPPPRTGKNQVIGRSYSETTRRARVAVEFQRSGGVAAGHQQLVESRPTGTQELYAQVAGHGPPATPELGQPHVGKRRPLLDETKGVKDFRLAKVGVGTNGVGSMPAVPSASLSPLPYSNRKTFTGKEKGEKSLPDDALEGGALPGYTGHLHARQHVYGKSYGHTSRQLQTLEPGETLLSKSGKLVSYTEHRPPGELLTDRGAKMPGYTGYVPVKNCYMYGQSYGKATALANEVEAAVRSGSDPLGMAELVDARPTGAPTLTMQTTRPQAPGKPVPYVAEPLPYRVSKGTVRQPFKERGEDNKWRDVIQDDVREVMEGTHKPVGWTGHTHGKQHVYGESVGKMTRRLRNVGDPTTSHDLLHFKDARPNAGNSNRPVTL